MTLLPVIERELRAESRSAFTYWLRFFGAVTLLTAGVLFFMHAGSVRTGSMTGGGLFQSLQRTMFVSLWVVAALMTADSISRERREDTLGILFLTPLRPVEVVLAKGLAHGLRAAGVCLAAVPVLVVPFLMGGVGWREVLVAVCMDFSALCWALAAGILASSCCRSMSRALVTAVVFELSALVGFVMVQGVGLATAAYGLRGSRSSFAAPSLDQYFSMGWHGILEAHKLLFYATQRGTTAMATRWLFWLGIIAVLSVFGCLLVAAVAARNVKKSVRQKGPSVVLQRAEKKFCTPVVALGLFRRWMRRVLERNPVGWLERRTWHGRLVMWSWLAVLISVLSWVAAAGFLRAEEVNAPLAWLGWLLVATVALTAAGSLRRERESGVIELLLVSPLSVQQIIAGRLRGIGSQYLLSALLLFGVWIWILCTFPQSSPYSAYGVYGFNLLGSVGHGLFWIWFLAITLLTIPVVGLYFSLRCRVFLVALFWTVGLGLALPWLASSAFWLSMDALENGAVEWVWLFGLLTGLCALALCRWPASASKGHAYTSAACLGIITLLTFGLPYHGTSTSPNGSAELLALLTCSALQIGSAVLLGTRLRRRLERRDFALPQ